MQTFADLVFLPHPSLSSLPGDTLDAIHTIMDTYGVERSTGADHLRNAMERNNPVQARVDFDNGWGVSVIRTPFSYGGTQGYYEVGVFHRGELCAVEFNGQEADVIGYCDEFMVTRIMVELQQRGAPADVVRTPTHRQPDKIGRRVRVREKKKGQVPEENVDGGVTGATGEPRRRRSRIRDAGTRPADDSKPD